MNKFHSSFFPAFFVACTLLWSSTAGAEPVRDKHVEAELIAEPVSIQPGQPFQVGLRLSMDEHWHTYWLNPGDSGLGTSITWDLPEGFKAGEIIWPHPQLISTPPLMTYGYEGETLLRVEITPPAELAGESVTLRARVDWLMCKEICLPGGAKLELTMRVGNDPTPDPRWADRFAAARAATPAPSDRWTVTGHHTADALVLRFMGPGPLDSVYFFPESDALIDHPAPQVLARDGEAWTLTIPRQPTLTEWPSRVVGVAVTENGWGADGAQPALAVDVDLGASAAGTNVAAAGGGSAPLTLPVALLLAFVGGLILNLMPCVFPVISIKLLGFVEQAGESRGRLLAHGLVFASGVLICFWLLAGTLLALRAGGAEIGWGFQLQSPRIVMGLAALFFVLGLSLFGLIEFGMSLTGAGQKLQSKGGYAGSFFSGLLATIVATPCTAPFMGAALGYALALPTLAAMAIFTALGLGMATPYVVLSSMPGLIRRVPRPGPWMESLKQAMGFLMMATVVWLLWVLSLQTAGETLIRMAVLFLALGLALWIAGRWGAIHRPLRTRVRARIIAIAMALLALGGTLAEPPARAGSTEPATTAGGVIWENFSPERVAELRASGTPVFIDFTAAWCLTCQVNKRVALYHRDVEAKFRELGVVTLRADWTDHNEVITRALADFGRSGVPLYVLYGRDPAAAPTLLPELLTPGLVINALTGI
ncbi:MAG TPA: protein-disulfide reductase DsbD family protein [Kiritimatiellia bacterium]|mgnify:CR=1 FL=1|nr:protein-disulfide reductase DsbD family protein [Kiritimatiellia bacterium]